MAVHTDSGKFFDVMAPLVKARSHWVILADSEVGCDLMLKMLLEWLDAGLISTPDVETGHAPVRSLYKQFAPALLKVVLVPKVMISMEAMRGSLKSAWGMDDSAIPLHDQTDPDHDIVMMVSAENRVAAVGMIDCIRTNKVTVSRLGDN